MNSFFQPLRRSQHVVRLYQRRLDIALNSLHRVPQAGRPFAAHSKRLRSSVTLQHFKHLLTDGKIPPGFKNFFPKKSHPKPSKPKSSKDSKKPEPGPSKSKKDETPKKSKKADSDKKAGSTGGSGAGGAKGDKPDPDRASIIRNLALTGMGVLGIGMLMANNQVGAVGPEISFQEFLTDYLEPGKVDKIEVFNKQTARVFLRDPATYGDGDDYQPDYQQNSQPGTQGAQGGLARVVHFTIGSVDSFERKIDQAQREMRISPRDFVPIQYTNERSWPMMILNFLPTMLTILIAFMIFRSLTGMGNFGGGSSRSGGIGNVFSIGKANPVVVNKGGEKVKTSFKDVAGLKEAKVEVMEFVEFLKDKERFTKLGAKIPKGALLVGPPGTGKTLLAKATAGEADCVFFSMSGSDFIEMFVGVGPSRVRDLFQQARANAPCIIFIDEIDAVGRARGKGGFSGGHDERENTLNQLLVEMDGFSSTSGVVVLGGTNRADILDKALLRPGRFDRQIMIDLPDLEDRQEIFMVHLRPLKLALPMEEVASHMSALTPGFTGADIANVCNEAALHAARHDRDAVTLRDFHSANDRVIGGLEKSHSSMTLEEKKLIAYHEAGHAVMGWFLKYADPLLKVTVIPRTSGALGFAQFLPKEFGLFNVPEIMDKMCMALGGRASEEIFFGEISTGAQDDLKKVTQMAYSQVQIYGMNAEVGHLSFPPSDENQFYKPYSEHLAQKIDEEASKLVREAYDRTLEMLKEKKQEVGKIADRLLEIETITHDDIVELLGPRPHQPANYVEYMIKSKEIVKKYGVEDPDAPERKEDSKTTASVSDEKSTGAKANLDSAKEEIKTDKNTLESSESSNDALTAQQGEGGAQNQNKSVEASSDDKDTSQQKQSSKAHQQSQSDSDSDPTNKHSNTDPSKLK